MYYLTLDRDQRPRGVPQRRRHCRRYLARGLPQPDHELHAARGWLRQLLGRLHGDDQRHRGQPRSIYLMSQLFSTTRRPAGSQAPVWTALLLILAILACNLPGQTVATPGAGASDRTASIASLEGEVVIRQSVGGAESTASVGQIVPPGAQLVTRGNGAVKLALPETSSFIRMGPDTSLTVLEMGRNNNEPVSRFGLLEGKVWVVLDPSAGE